MEMPRSTPGDALPLTVEASRDAIEAGIRLGFGTAALTIEIARQVLAQALGQGNATAPQKHQSAVAVDALLGLALGGAIATVRAAETTVRITAPVTSTALNLMLEPPLVPRVLKPGTHVNSLARAWRAQRTDLARSALRSGQLASPVFIESAVRLLNINQLIATIIDQIDIDALALELMDRVKVEPLVAQIVAKVDVVEVVGRVMDELPTDRLVAEVISRLDMEALITAALDQVNLTDIVVENVDLATIVNAALDRIDITSIVMNRVDLPLIANTVIDEIDLAGTIRESSGSVASEMVQEARISSFEADRAVARLVDRFTLRRKARKLDAPGEPESLLGQTVEPQDPTTGQTP